MKYLVAIAVVLTVALLVSSCRSEATQESWANYQTALQQMDADGVRTAEEQANVAMLLTDHFKLERDEIAATDWKETGGTALATLLASIFATNAYRNRRLPGSSRKEE